MHLDTYLQDIKMDFNREINKELSKALEEIKDNPEKVGKILVKAGICDKEGNLTKHYK